MKMYSFDVFDTLITRRTSTPRGVFLLMQKKKAKISAYKDASESFAELRYEAEHNAEKFYSDKEIDIYDIYSVLAERLHLEDNQIEELIELEISTEIECVIPRTEYIDLVKSKVRDKERVILISDMYLKSDHIRRILRSVDPVFENLPLYVSCECGGTKANGKLYSFVRDKESIEYEDWQHYGDNIISDHNIPLLFGIKPISVKAYPISTIEKNIMKQFHVEEEYDPQLFLGIIKELCDRDQEYAYKMGTICGGAILFPYVRWIVDEAFSKGIRKLFFMSRDGYILRKIAKQIINDKGLDIETEYIYVSKDVLRAEGKSGELTEGYLKRFLSDDNFAFVDFQGTGNSLVSIASRLGIKIRGFYYLLNGDPHRDNVELFWYTYAPIKSGLVEIACRAPHGAVVGYEKKGDTIEPILSSIDESIWEKCGFYDYEKGAIDFASVYLNLLDKDLPEIDLDMIARYIIDYCENAVDPQTAGFIGDFPHSDNNGSESAGFAPQLSSDVVGSIYGIRGDEPIEYYYKGSNIDYSLKRSGLSYKKLILDAIGRDERVANNSGATRVIIYAAGKYGYEAWYRLNRNPDYSVVAWVDMNYQSCDNDIVESPIVIKDMDYDIILVCLYNEKSFDDVKNLLAGVGADRSKVLWIRDFWDGFFI